MGKRKYEEVKGYWVYSIKVASIGKYYIGVSKTHCHRRWQKTRYKGSSLEPYLDEWQDMIKTVLVDNLSSKEEALIMEDNIIRALSMNNLCINERRSGLIASDENAYKRGYYENNNEYRERAKQRCKQYYEDNKQQIREYKRQWRLKNKDKINQQAKQRRLKKKLEQQHTVVD